MNAGIQVFNDNQILQIDSDYRNARFAFSGYCNTKAIGSNSYFVDISLSAESNSSIECPMVLIRPEQAENYVGGCFVNSPHGEIGSFPARPNGAVQLWGQCPFDWAVLSTRVAIGSGGSPYGFDVFDENGNLVFASAYSQLRITEVFEDPDSNGWPKSFGLTRGQSNPWIWANPMIGIAGGPYDSFFPGIVSKFNSSRNVLTVNALDLITMSALPPPGNQFANVRRYFGTAAY